MRPDGIRTHIGAGSAIMEEPTAPGSLDREKPFYVERYPLGSARPQRDSNPCCGLEKPVS